MTSGPVLQYHDPGDPRYSLRYLTDDRDGWISTFSEFSRQDGTEAVSHEELIDGQTIYLIYTRTEFEAAYLDFESDEEAIDWILDHFTEDDAQVAMSVLDVFDGILTEKKEQDAEFKTYKEMDLERIPEILNRVEWQQPVPDVGAELLSQFILTHPMPNTNHRTAIGLLDRYLTSIDDSFVMPDTGVEDEWFAWARGYILDSKRLLTLRRNVPLFRVAQELGYEAVERKEGITIPLNDSDLGQEDPHSYYTDHHLERSRDFVEMLLEEADATHLEQEMDQGKRTFTERLRGDQ